MAKTPGGIPAKDWRLAQRIARKHRVDPLLLVSIGKIETDWGRLGDGRNGNILGVGSFDSGSSYKWAGVRNQLKKGAELLQSWGVHGIKDVKAGKASSWATDPNWENAVSSMHAQLAGGNYSKAPGRTRRPRRSPGRLVTTTSRTPGVDLSAQRQSLKLDVLTTALSQGRMPSQTELLGLGSGLRELKDTPGETTVNLEFRPGRRQPARGGAQTATGASVNQLMRKAKRWARAKPAYLWGGGHAAIAKVGDRVDCSGFVSAMVGLKTPMVSGDLARWGKPGKGRYITVYANDGHTFMSIRNRKGKERFFGTSSQGNNPGGGVTEFHPSPEYLKGFAVRHPG